LYKYISGKYNGIQNFSNVSGIPPEELDAVLLKENIVLEISSVIELCRTLNLDIENLALNGEISETNPDKNYKSGTLLTDEFYNRYIRLSAVEKKKVVEYMDSI
jgi:hypothetical protein